MGPSCENIYWYLYIYTVGNINKLEEKINTSCSHTGSVITVNVGVIALVLEISEDETVDQN